MARIRTIKPEFWTSESIGRLSRDARLCFISMWNLADDSGRLRGGFAYLSGAAFPYDADAREKMQSWISELVREGMVRRYIAGDGNTYIDIPKWLTHQKIDKPSPSKIPAFTEHSTSIPRKLTEASPLEQGTGNRDQGEDLVEDQVAIAPALHVVPDEQTPTVGPDMLLKTGKAWRCPKSLANNICHTLGIGPDDFLDECDMAALWLVNNPGKRKTASGMGRFVTGWMKRKLEYHQAKKESAETDPGRFIPKPWTPELQAIYDGTDE